MRIRPSSIPQSMLDHPAVVAGLVAVTMLTVAGVRANTPATHGGSSLEPSPPAEVKVLAPYDMSWWSVDGGGGASSGGVFALTGAIGQPDAGLARACGIVLEGGMWSGPVPSETPLFCDGFETGDVGMWSEVTP
jgi:hypothetical protein